MSIEPNGVRRGEHHLLDLARPPQVGRGVERAHAMTLHVISMLGGWPSTSPAASKPVEDDVAAGRRKTLRRGQPEAANRSGDRARTCRRSGRAPFSRPDVVSVTCATAERRDIAPIVDLLIFDR